MSETPNGEKFESDYDDNKDSRPSDPVSDGIQTTPAADIVPDHTDVDEDDSAEPEDADVQHLASAKDVEAAE